MRTTKEDFALYMRWQKYILDTRPALPKGIARSTLIAYCFAMAVKGTNGKGCFASDTKIGGEIGISRREVVGHYRNFAVDLGWFVFNGKRRGRAKELDVSIPDSEGVENVTPEHDQSQSPGNCPACKRDLARMYAGEISMTQLFEIHAGRMSL